MNKREEIARRYGFESYAALLDVSEPLPPAPEDETRTYVARHKEGYWFVWEDLPPAEPLAASEERSRRE